MGVQLNDDELIVSTSPTIRNKGANCSRWCSSKYKYWNEKRERAAQRYDDCQ
jgi:hypothetical protein